MNWDETENLYIEGDNLEVLKLLQHSYHGRVKIAYLDPPYNTGHDFVYKDRFGDTIENYRAQAKLVGQSNAETSGRYHSDWCSMMYPRLRLARELLSEDGIIFISINEIEVTNLIMICNEIFGDSNYVASIAWQNLDTVKNDAKYFSSNHEYILCYARSIERLKIQGVKKGQKQLDYYRNPDNDPRGPYLLTPLHAKSGSESGIYTYTFSNGQTWKPPEGTYPRFSKETLHKLDEEGRLQLDPRGINTPQKKTYLADVGDRMPPTTFWDYRSYGSTRRSNKELSELIGKGVFQNPKPTQLLQALIDLVQSNDNAIVLDLFSGSGTTADALIRLNSEDGGKRKFILVQLPEQVSGKFETICEIGKERIRRAGAKIAAEVEEANRQLKLGEEPKPIPDIGFRVLKLDESGIERPKPGELLLDVVKPDRTDEDIIFEMMLKWGLELTLPIEKVDAAGYPCYSVAYGELICCLAPGLNMQVLDAIADMEPRRVLMLDRNLDDTTKLNAVQAFKRVEEKTGREVELRTV